MGNMGYCRFRNTLTALRDCQVHLNDNLVEEEAHAKAQLVKVCKSIVNDEYEDQHGDDSEDK